ncbi:NtaA/DmoA family FMN-dependent monooxygenase [Pseudochelatococcus contaminans]|uniref:FMN-dependent oxidoreductase (Nitrilotriacetate monooxygenase family) n=1 Tax=Pseudochelatococcus contaminans TaxID=1538103 RepID=A0A7W5Z5B0_9HYPH|nr:NtaA/DmoA family FMN-dependent monooxygenase [Pseudochelatococcus contaminans]MBB3810460.1 FMN-dependent oxidoreductase (nitrilotriacetate monooxygenase family) [Pseudochelatococcus contaminans]
MSPPRDRLILVAFADPNSFYQGDLAAQRDPHRFKIENFINHAKLAESAGFDAIFKPDFLGLDPLKADVRPRAGFEPLTLLTALSQHTKRVGLIVTESTSFTEPFNVARYFTSLDNLSNGRSGWNVVTSYYGEQNFAEGKLLPLAERYEKADEYLRVVYKLWESWKEGSVSYDETGHHFNGDFIEETDFNGEYFRIKQALDIPPGPQGRPVIVQAGASEEGLDFAARHAEIVFTATPDIDAGLSFYRDLKQRVTSYGRSAESVKVLPGLNAFIAPTAKQADEIYHSQFTDKNLLKYRDKVVREAPLFRLSELDLDDPIPASAIPSVEELTQVERRRSRGLLLRPYFARPGVTLRQVLSSIYEFGHFTLIGTPQTIADEIALWFQSEASDGFVLKGGNSFASFAEEVIPILRDKGVVKEPSPEAETFRQALFGPAL